MTDEPTPTTYTERREKWTGGELIAYTETTYDSETGEELDRVEWEPNGAE